MSRTRPLITLLICLGLALPGAHGVVLCVGRDGNIALEVAVDGVCTSALTRNCGPASMCDLESTPHADSLAAHSTHHGCNDTSLGRDTVPVSEVPSAKRLAAKPGSDGLAATRPVSDREIVSAYAKRDAGATCGSPLDPLLESVILLL
jgi:hypothetical protein